MARTSILTLLLLTVAALAYAQTDLSVQQPLKIESAQQTDGDGNTQLGTPLRMPSIITSDPESSISKKEKTIQMLPDRELVRAGYGMKIDPKVGPSESKEGSNQRFGDMYLGDVKSNGKFIGIVCRDHEYVDGDRVKIMVNDRMVDPNVMLTGAFKGVNVDLEPGFNKLDFIALNEGSSPPNTAQVDVYDDKGNLLYSNKWLLSTGSKATLIVTKE